MDVSYALNEVYSGIYSCMNQIRSLGLERYSYANIPKDLNILYLTYIGRERIPFRPAIRKGKRDTCPDYPRSTRPDVQRNRHRTDYGETNYTTGCHTPCWR
ncbi:hypothetical protein EVAR_49077_1 [Eumeta japonica]|uniref:Uncharacterized protein n=1 Tax=Eumeta variegata TaxID=151549 RepID=A0A4C2ADI9_EUMVA|nr:hypothetical protein EVAR_49077_1 [Eumeta japonica]